MIASFLLPEPFDLGHDTVLVDPDKVHLLVAIFVNDVDPLLYLLIGISVLFLPLRAASQVRDSFRILVNVLVI